MQKDIGMRLATRHLRRAEHSIAKQIHQSECLEASGDAIRRRRGRNASRYVCEIVEEAPRPLDEPYLGLQSRQRAPLIRLDEIARHRPPDCLLDRENQILQPLPNVVT